MGISLYFKSYYKKGMITLHHAFAFNMALITYFDTITHP
jgi:hypothetical protein